MKRPALYLLLACLWMLSVGMAYRIGSTPMTPTAPSPSPIAAISREALPAAAPSSAKMALEMEESPEDASLESLPEQLASRPVPDRVPAQPTPARRIASPSEIGRYVAATFRSGNPAERARAVAQMLDRLTPENIRQALDAARAELESDQGGHGSPRHGNNYEVAEMLLFSYGQMDGDAAMDYVKTITGEGGERFQQWAATTVLSGWSTQHPDDALAWAKANFEGEENPYLVGVVAGVAEQNVYRAYDITKTLPYGFQRGRAVEVLLDEFFEQNPTAVPGWAAGLEAGRLKNGIVARVAGRWAATEPAAAAAWVSQIADKEAQPEAVARVAAAWAESDPARTADWVVDMGGGHSLAMVMQRWARTDLNAASAWLTTKPAAPEWDSAKAALVNVLFRTRPDSALAWASSIQDADLRFETTDNIVRDWLKRDPDAATRYLQSGGHL